MPFHHRHVGDAGQPPSRTPARAAAVLVAVLLGTAAVVPAQFAAAAGPFGAASTPTEPSPTPTAPTPDPTEPPPAEPTPTPTAPAPDPTEPPPTEPLPTEPPPTEPFPAPTEPPPAPSQPAPTQAPPGPTTAPAPPVPPPPAPPVLPTRPLSPAPPGADTPLSDPNRLTAGERAAQDLELQRLAAESAFAGAGVAEARVRLEELAAAAGAALEALREAELKDNEAALVHEAQRQELAQVMALADDREAELGRWAASAYRDGGALAGFESIATVFESRDAADLGDRLLMLERVGRLRGDVVTTAQEAEDRQLDAAGAATENSVAALAASLRADGLRVEADQLVAKQQAQVAALAALMALSVDVEGGEVMRIAAARAVAEQRRLAALDDGSGNRLTGAVGDCPGRDLAPYPNGSIPLSALCVVTDGEFLRADSAFALTRMSAAYEQEWGVPICVTDGYRPLESQVSLYATKPDLAAVPGTSNHGWGTAIDLCGGIQTFGTGPHRWMRENAPLFGWFHPSWAQQTGSRPEPWHWEFGG